MDTRLIERQGEFLGALAAELATVIGSLLDVPGTALPVELPAGAKWIVRIKLAGALKGSATLGFESEGAALVAARLMGLDGDPPTEAIADTLNEITAQAVGALGQTPLGLGTSFSLEGVPAPNRPQPPGEPLSFELGFGDGVAHVSSWTDLVAAEEEPASRPTPAPPPARPAGPAPSGAPGATAPAAAALSAAPPQVSANRPDNLDMILDVELPISVRFGQTEMSLQALSALGPGSIIEIGRSPDDPVELLINGKTIARGEVVVVAGNYGVRVTEVISATERIRTLGA